MSTKITPDIIKNMIIYKVEIKFGILNFLYILDICNHDCSS